MENQKQRTNSIDSTTANEQVTNSSPTRSYSPPPDPKPSSPAAESSLSSDLSHRSSPSHGSSLGEEHTRPASPPGTSPPRSPSLQPIANRFVRNDPVAATTTKVDPGGVGDGLFGGAAEGGVGVGVGGGGGGGGGGRRARQSLPILRRVKREKMVKKAALGFRVFGLLFCLISLAVMAADKNKGWALDSFDRYEEFRYCLAVNAIGFVYSLIQVSDLAYYLSTGEYVFRHPLRYYFDFAMDQILTYLLMSASSSAATRVDDWQSNWGKDKFPEMATASVGMSFVAFLAFAACSLISGYCLCAFRST